MHGVLLVGLGNPGTQYKNNRHNVGFLIVDFLASKFCVSFKSKGESSFALFPHKGCSVVLLKPQTFMNLSGKSVSQISSFFKIPTNDIVVIHDDLDLKFGACKMKIGGGNGGHNGIKSIDSCVSNNYWRFRVGIDRPEFREQVVSYVLGDFWDEQLDQIEKIADDIFLNFDCLLGEDKHKLVEKINNRGKS